MVVDPLATGNTADSENGVPSRFDAVAHFDEATEIRLGHQSGHEVTDLFLTSVDEDSAGPSYNGPYAQLSIVRLSD